MDTITLTLILLFAVPVGTAALVHWGRKGFWWGAAAYLIGAVVSVAFLVGLSVLNDQGMPFFDRHVGTALTLPILGVLASRWARIDREKKHAARAETP